VAVFLFFLPESPKFLLTRNDHQKALEVFKQIYATNTGNDPEMYPVSRVFYFCRVFGGRYGGRTALTIRFRVFVGAVVFARLREFNNARYVRF